MILENLNIEAFRGMTNVKLENLAPVNIVVGDNNCGKTSILEAAALLLRPFDPPQWVNVARQRNFDLSVVDGMWGLFPSTMPLIVEEGCIQSTPLQIGGSVGEEKRLLSARA